MKNIFGTDLVACRKSNSQDQRGSWDTQGMCSDRGARDPGVHQICFSVRDDTENFSEATYQSDWSRDRKDKHHCMCLGAYSLYKQRQKIGEIPETDNELKCHAIPESALSEKYLKNWAKWNGHEREYQLHENYMHALDQLCTQCAEQAETESEASSLRNLCDRMLAFES
ncbi:MAG: hypothetical protein CL450_07565 [Acidimicrobiaceae bacterium]|nr:hypothetical protein [Acidimicrobiaceae bacterium]